MKLAEILTGPETWCQQYFDSAGRGCLVWALDRMAGFGEYRGLVAPFHEMQRLERIIFGDVGDGDPGPRIGSWNDAEGRTWDEIATVVDAYDRDRMLNP